ncbi:MAG: hypothetical protein GY816_10690 [Cytophagales bacterium]|nr:hypothetical protein [Cytophagales bacterium]
MKTSSFRVSILSLSISFLVIGCKTNEPISQKAIGEDFKTVATIEKADSAPEKDEIGIEEEDIARAEGVREYSDVQRLGSQEIKLRFLKKEDGPTFINLHDDENTSVKAAFKVLDSLGGRLIELRHLGERNIKFNLNSTAYEFDPNRMFTDLGAKTSLEQYSKMSTKAHESIRGLAQRVVDSLDSQMIVTLHNNTNDNYSSLSYLDEYKTDAAAVFINPTRDPDDFFFVTTLEFFEKFRNMGYNTVLQNNETMTDDGSLSVLAGRLDIPYINVEAEHGHFKEQVEMMFALISVLHTK